MGKRKQKNISSFWSIAKLRATLFRIWFVKNILVFGQAGLIVCIILMITGSIGPETPILGMILYPIFSDMIDEIRLAIASKNMEGWMDFGGKIISVAVSASLFMIKARSIAQTDIKSVKLKKALINAGLYFNEDGKLVKKDKSIHQDKNGDGVIDKNDGKVSSNVFTGMIDAIKEFIVIANADFSGNEEEDKELYEETLSKAKLDETAEGLDDLDSQMKDKLKFKKDNGEVVDDEIEADDTEKEVKEKLLKKFGKWVKANFQIGRVKVQVEKINDEYDEEEYEDDEEYEEEDYEIVENNMDEHAEDNDKISEEKEEIVEVVKEEEKAIVQPQKITVSVKTKSNSAAVDDFLAKLRKK